MCMETVLACVYIHHFIYRTHLSTDRRCTTGATAAAGGASRPGGSNASGSRRQRAPDPHWLGQGDDEDGEEEDEEMELEGALEALLREGPRRAPSPLSASAGAAGAKLLDGTGDDAKQPPRGAAAEAAAEAEAEGGQARNGNGNANGNGKGHGDKDKEEPSAAEEALAARVRELEARLVETEALLGSDPGTVILALEVGGGVFRGLEGWLDGVFMELVWFD